MASDTEEHRRRFGRNLHFLRTERNLTKERIGELVESRGGLGHPLRRNEIWRYERGDHYPGLPIRIALARVLAVPVTALDEDSPPGSPTTEDQDPAA